MALDHHHHGFAPPSPPYAQSNLIAQQARASPKPAQKSLVASAVVPSSHSSEVISTLIKSLTALSDSARDQLEEEEQIEETVHEADGKDNASVVVESIYTTDQGQNKTLTRARRNFDSRTDESSDGDVATSPSVPLKRSFLPRPTKPKKSSPRLYAHSTMLQHATPRRSSFQSMDDHRAMGFPSIERRNGSNTNLSMSPTPDTTNDLRTTTQSSPPQQQQPPPDLGQPILPIRSSSDTAAMILHRQSNSIGRDIEFSMGQRSPSSVRSRSSEVYSVSPTGDGPAISALSPLAKSDLGNHLIPSRRSSLKRSTQLSENGKENYRQTAGSRDLKDLNIDSDLIENDDSTVRRIREVQEAREQRQREWRKEAKRSDRTGKRSSHSTPKASQRTNSYQGSRLSLSDIVVETPEIEAAVQLSATLTATDLAGMPVPIPSPNMKNGNSESPLPSAPTQTSMMPNGADSRNLTTPQTSRRVSIHLKRSSTSGSRRGTPVSEGKSISEEVESFVTASRLTQKIRHPRTGRTIAFSEVGDPNGFVVICCVGMGLTRYVMTFYDELARTLKLRLITPDRPGVGESQSLPESSNTPLNWVDDVAVICNSLEIARFSLLAHSAGAIHALATALKMPQYVRGRIHLLAPWIPPSQMPKGAALGPHSQPIANLPFSHKVLSVLPAPILKVANSRFLSATSASVETKPWKTTKKAKKPGAQENGLGYTFHDINGASFDNVLASIENESPDKESPLQTRNVSCYQANNDTLAAQGVITKAISPEPRLFTPPSRQQTSSPRPNSPRLTSEARQGLYNSTLTHRIWALSTQNANPAIDLLVCLERRKTIGFRYPEVTRSVVIHHGTRDTRVPLDNAKWLQGVMKRCELRIIADEGHGLMASASVMSSVLTEIGREWEEWDRIARGKEKKRAMREDGEIASIKTMR